MIYNFLRIFFDVFDAYYYNNKIEKIIHFPIFCYFDNWGIISLIKKYGFKSDGYDRNILYFKNGDYQIYLDRKIFCFYNLRNTIYHITNPTLQDLGEILDKEFKHISRNRKIKLLLNGKN